MARTERACVAEDTRFQLSRTPARPRSRAPFLGEHTLEVLTEVLGSTGWPVMAAAEVLE